LHHRKAEEVSNGSQRYSQDIQRKERRLTMELLPKGVQDTLPPLYSQEGKGMDAIAQVKFFTPTSSWTWWATEYDPETRTFFGLVEGFERELGYFSLDELQEAKGPFGLGVERDLYWDPKPLKEV
jgi:hypothetical protein